MTKCLRVLALCGATILPGCGTAAPRMLPASYESVTLAQAKNRAEQACGGDVWVWNLSSDTSVEPFRVYWTVLYRCKATQAFIGPYQITEDF